VQVLCARLVLPIAIQSASRNSVVKKVQFLNVTLNFALVYHAYDLNIYSGLESVKINQHAKYLD